MGELRNMHSFFGSRTWREDIPSGRPRRRWEDNIIMMMKMMMMDNRIKSKPDGEYLVQCPVSLSSSPRRRLRSVPVLFLIAELLGAGKISTAKW
jgi:hypothetical protein